MTIKRTNTIVPDCLHVNATASVPEPRIVFVRLNTDDDIDAPFFCVSLGSSSNSLTAKFVNDSVDIMCELEVEKDSTKQIRYSKKKKITKRK